MQRMSQVVTRAQLGAAAAWSSAAGDRRSLPVLSCLSRVAWRGCEANVEGKGVTSAFRGMRKRSCPQALLGLVF